MDYTINGPHVCPTWMGEELRWLEQSIAGAGPEDQPFRQYECSYFVLRSPYYMTCTCGYQAEYEEFLRTHQHSWECYQHDLRVARAGAELRAEPFDAEVLENLCRKHGIPYAGGRGSLGHCGCGFREQSFEFRHSHSHSCECDLWLPVFETPGVQIWAYLTNGRPIYVSYANWADGPEHRDSFHDLMKQCRGAAKTKESKVS